MYSMSQRYCGPYVMQVDRTSKHKVYCSGNKRPEKETNHKNKLLKFPFAFVRLKVEQDCIIIVIKIIFDIIFYFKIYK